jgi:hypothetical protein
MLFCKGFVKVVKDLHYVHFFKFFWIKSDQTYKVDFLVVQFSVFNLSDHQTEQPPWNSGLSCLLCYIVGVISHTTTDSTYILNDCCFNLVGLQLEI